MRRYLYRNAGFIAAALLIAGLFAPLVNPVELSLRDSYLPPAAEPLLVAATAPRPSVPQGDLLARQMLKEMPSLPGTSVPAVSREKLLRDLRQHDIRVIRSLYGAAGESAALQLLGTGDRLRVAEFDINRKLGVETMGPDYAPVRAANLAYFMPGAASLIALSAACIALGTLFGAISLIAGGAVVSGVVTIHALLSMRFEAGRLAANLRADFPATAVDALTVQYQWGWAVLVAGIALAGWAAWVFHQGRALMTRRMAA